MKCFVTRTSDWNDTSIKSFETMEDLKRFIKNCKHPVVVNIPWANDKRAEGCDLTVEIYDDWRE